jgi:hypothetical protein
MKAKKKTNKKKLNMIGGAIISDKVGNYENHPFFVKKAEEAKAFLDKAGIPKELLKKLKDESV